MALPLSLAPAASLCVNRLHVKLAKLAHGNDHMDNDNADPLEHNMALKTKSRKLCSYFQTRTCGTTGCKHRIKFWEDTRGQVIQPRLCQKYPAVFRRYCNICKHNRDHAVNHSLTHIKRIACKFQLELFDNVTSEALEKYAGCLKKMPDCRKFRVCARP